MQNFCLSFIEVEVGVRGWDTVELEKEHLDKLSPKQVKL